MVTWGGRKCETNGMRLLIIGKNYPMIYFNCTYANLPELAFNVFPIHQYIYIYCYDRFDNKGNYTLELVYLFIDDFFFPLNLKNYEIFKKD